MPGDYKISREPHRISTVLGSCVSVCLFHPRLHCGGMNHYMLPQREGPGPDGGKYGQYAISALFKFFEENAGSLSGLEAMIFGGANVLNFDKHAGARIGELNIAKARTMLRDRGIPVIREQVGGSAGLKLSYQNWDNSIEVTPLSQIAPADVEFMRKGILDTLEMLSKYQT